VGVYGARLDGFVFDANWTAEAGAGKPGCGEYLGSGGCALGELRERTAVSQA
jgi:hypothetical protein